MTIAEIAQRAGVSKSAVSRYLNNGYVSGEKREAIQKVIEETGYKPSQQAQMLRTGKSKMIGVIVPRIDSDSVSRIVSGISEVLEQNQYRLLLANTQNQPEKELEYLEVFKRGNVDAVIFIATILTKAHKQAILSCNVPIVLIGQQMDGVSCIYHDDKGAAYNMTQILVENNRTNIGYIGVTVKDKAAGEQRLIGVCEAIEPKIKETSDFTLDGGYQAMQRIFAKNCHIDGLFCATDTIALGAIKFLKEKNINVPEQISVVGIGDSRMSQLVLPQLTTARYFYKDSGKQAAELIMQNISQPINSTIQTKMGYEICKRESVIPK